MCQLHPMFPSCLWIARVPCELRPGTPFGTTAIINPAYREGQSSEQSEDTSQKPNVSALHSIPSSYPWRVILTVPLPPHQGYTHPEEVCARSNRCMLTPTLGMPTITVMSRMHGTVIRVPPAEPVDCWSCDYCNRYAPGSQPYSIVL